MGVDYYPCQRCGETFPNCGWYIRCNDECGMVWCSDRCAEKDGFIRDDEVENEYGESPCSCKYCRNEDITDDVFAEVCIKLIGKPREQIVKEYLETNKPK